MESSPELTDYVVVGGKERSRVNSDGVPIDVTTSGIEAFWRWFGDSAAVDDHGRPVPIFHGTAALFHRFSADAHRTVLNDEYQGDGFHFSPDESVAERYSNASRNQCFNKARMYAALEATMPALLTSTFKTVVEHGYDQTWELPEDQIRKILDCAVDHGIDINDLLDLAEYVEGSRYHHGRKFNDPGELHALLGGGGGLYLPDHAIQSAVELGLRSAVPDRRVIACYLKVEKPMRTNSPARAKTARAKGFDGVLYTGKGTVAGVPEWIVYDPSQIKSICDFGRWHADEEDFERADAPRYLTRTQARRELVRAWDEGKNAGTGFNCADPTSNDDGTGWLRANVPIDLVRANEEGDRYDSTTNYDRAKSYADNPISAPLQLVFRVRSVLNGHTTAAVVDGGHRISAARMRGDSYVPAIMQRSQYMLLLATNRLETCPEITPDRPAKRARP
jgi:hypothetical protein